MLLGNTFFFLDCYFFSIICESLRYKINNEERLFRLFEGRDAGCVHILVYELYAAFVYVSSSFCLDCKALKCKHGIKDIPVLHSMHVDWVVWYLLWSLYADYMLVMCKTWRGCVTFVYSLCAGLMQAVICRLHQLCRLHKLCRLCRLYKLCYT